MDFTRLPEEMRHKVIEHVSDANDLDNWMKASAVLEDDTCYVVGRRKSITVNLNGKYTSLEICLKFQSVNSVLKKIPQIKKIVIVIKKKNYLTRGTMLTLLNQIYKIKLINRNLIFSMKEIAFIDEEIRTCASFHNDSFMYSDSIATHYLHGIEEFMKRNKLVKQAQLLRGLHNYSSTTTIRQNSLFK